MTNKALARSINIFPCVNRTRWFMCSTFVNSSNWSISENLVAHEFHYSTRPPDTISLLSEPDFAHGIPNEGPSGIKNSISPFEYLLTEIYCFNWFILHIFCVFCSTTKCYCHSKKGAVRILRQQVEMWNWFFMLFLFYFFWRQLIFKITSRTKLINLLESYLL